MQESFLILRVIRKLRKDKAFEFVEGKHREAVTGVRKKRHKFARKWTSSVEEHLVISQKSPRKERTVDILRGGFTTSHEPLDLMEK
jgi:hypothetical protein